MRKHCPVLDLACTKWNGAVPHTRKTDLNLENIIALEGKRLVFLQGGVLQGKSSIILIIEAGQNVSALGILRMMESLSRLFHSILLLGVRNLRVHEQG